MRDEYEVRMPDDTETRWIHPETRRRTALNARDTANAARWSLNTAVSLFGLIILVLLMGMYGVNILLTTLVGFSGLLLTWFAGQRKAKKLYGCIYDEEIARCPDEWKDYYRNLGIGPCAGEEKIRKAYENLSLIHDRVMSERSGLMPLFSMKFREAREAYEILIDPVTKAEYDRVFWLKYNGETADIEIPARSTIVDLSHSISNEVAEYFTKFGWDIPRLGRTKRKAVLIVAAVVLAAGVSGTSFAFARPDSALAAPFRVTAVTVARMASGAIELLDDVISVGASSERQVISSSVQLMRVAEEVSSLTPVVEPVNDMAGFPSKEHSLYPDYVDRRYSQFSYTVDSNGIVTVHADEPTTEPMLEKIRSFLLDLE